MYGCLQAKDLGKCCNSHQAYSKCMFHQISEGSGSILCTEFHIRTQSRFIAIVVLMKGSLFSYLWCVQVVCICMNVYYWWLCDFFIMHIQVPGCLCVFLLLFWGRFNEEINLHDWHFFVFCYHFWSNKHCVSVKPSFSEIPTCSVKFMN